MRVNYCVIDPLFSVPLSSCTVNRTAKIIDNSSYKASILLGWVPGQYGVDCRGIRWDSGKCVTPPRYQVIRFQQCYVGWCDPHLDPRDMPPWRYETNLHTMYT